MKAILISIKPKYVADILNHKKTIEVRKSMPKCDLPIDVYIYCTKEKELLHKNCANIYWVEDTNFKAKNKKLGLETQPYLNGKVVAKFTLNKVEEIYDCWDYQLEEWSFKTDTLKCENFIEKSCLNYDEIEKYFAKSLHGYAWHISNLEIFDRPKELSGGWFTKRDCRTCPFNYEDMDGDECIGCIIEKAPQSWCYVEVE